MAVEINEEVVLSSYSSTSRRVSPVEVSRGTGILRGVQRYIIVDFRVVLRVVLHQNLSGVTHVSRRLVLNK